MSSDTQLNRDNYWMEQALRLARYAEEQGEVPVGAVLVLNDGLVAEGWNQPITSCDPTAHAEVVALRKGAIAIGNYRLLETTLYVTLEPCAMCATALVHARVRRLVYGATEPRAGAAGSVFNIVEHSALNHCLEHQGGVLADESSGLLKAFFERKRKAK